MTEREQAGARAQLNCSVSLTKWLKIKLKYHLWVDHKIALGDEVIHNVCANIAMGQVEAARACFEERGEN